MRDSIMVYFPGGAPAGTTGQLEAIRLVEGNIAVWCGSQQEAIRLLSEAEKMELKHENPGEND